MLNVAGTPVEGGNLGTADQEIRFQFDFNIFITIIIIIKIILVDNVWYKVFGGHETVGFPRL